MYKIFKLSFKNSIFIGTNKCSLNISENIIHSDTLYSAIINVASAYDSLSLEKLLNWFENEQIVLSSAFPFFNDTFYVPKPFEFNNILEKILVDTDIKKIKNLDFIPLEIIYNLRNKNYDTMILKKKIFQIEKIYKEEFHPRNTIDRTETKSELFGYKKVSFVNNSQTKTGLYFILKFEDEIQYIIFKKFLHYLKLNGIGGERTIGNGLFDFEENEIGNDLKLLLEQNSDNNINLSLFYPIDESHLRESLKEFELIKRSGFVFSFVSSVSVKRKSVYMFKEGSIFKKRIKGKIVDVTPSGFKEHKVYRYGKSLFLSF